jgi:hypothetical protein
MSDAQLPGSPTKKPLAKPLQWLIVGVVVAPVAGFFWWDAPTHRSCTVRETSLPRTVCTVAGLLKPISDANKALNAKSLGSTQLDQITIEDASGERVIYFDPTKFSLEPGATVTLVGSQMAEQGSGNMRFLVRAQP